MKTFTKITATTAALLLTAGVTFAATIQSADASGTDTGDLCVIATRVDDPSIKAQRGKNCPTAEPAPPARPVSVVLENNIQVYDADWNPLPFHVRAVNQRSGAVVMDQDFSVGYVASVSDPLEIPAATDRPTYRVTVTVNGKSYSYSLTPDQYTERDGEWVLHCDAFLENGVFRLQFPPTS